MSGNGLEGNGMGLRIFAMALAAAMPAAAFAAPIAPSCPAAPVLPPELAGWSRDAAGKTIYAYGDDLAADWSPLGAARTELPLHKYESLRYGVAPGRKPDLHQLGGIIPVEVQKGGRLIRTLDAGARDRPVRPRPP